MPVKSKCVKLSLNPAHIPKLIEIGRENHLQNLSGSLKLTTICSKILQVFLSLQNDDDVRAYLERRGGGLLNLIQVAVRAHIRRDL